MKDHKSPEPASKRLSRQTRIAQKLKRGKFSTRHVSDNQKRQSRKILLFCVGFHVVLLLILASFSIGSALLDQDFTIVAVFGTERTEEFVPEVIPEVPIEVVDDFDADDDAASGAESPEMDSAAAETEVVEKEAAPVEDTTPVSALAALMSDSALEDVGGSGGTGSEGNGTGSGRGLLFPTMPRPEGKPNNSVADGLAWLVDVQHRDGYWSFQRTGRESTMGSVDCNLAATGLAVLCMTKAGVDDDDLPYSNRETKEAKAEGLQWLVEATRAEVDTAAPVGGDFVSYGLPIAVLALAEEFLGDPFNDDVRDVLEGAVRTLESWQGVESGGWGYDPNEANLSVSVWTTLALNAAQDAGIRLKRRTIPAANYYVMSLEDEANLAFRYRRRQGTTPAMTAGGTLCRILYLAGSELDLVEPTVHRLATMGPSKDDPEFDYFATQAMHHWGESVNESWQPQMSQKILSTQVKDGRAKGSWIPTDLNSFRAGQLYQTELNLLTLLTPATTNSIRSLCSAGGSPLAYFERRHKTYAKRSEVIVDVTQVDETRDKSQRQAEFDIADMDLLVEPIHVTHKSIDFTIGPNHPSPLVREIFHNIELVAAAYDARDLRLTACDLASTQQRGWLDTFHRDSGHSYARPVPTDNFTFSWSYLGEGKSFTTHRLFDYLPANGADLGFQELVAVEIGYAIVRAIWCQFHILEPEAAVAITGVLSDKTSAGYEAAFPNYTVLRLPLEISQDNLLPQVRAYNKSTGAPAIDEDPELLVSGSSAKPSALSVRSVYLMRPGQPPRFALSPHPSGSDHDGHTNDSVRCFRVLLRQLLSIISRFEVGSQEYNKTLKLLQESIYKGSRYTGRNHSVMQRQLLKNLMLLGVRVDWNATADEIGRPQFTRHDLSRTACLAFSSYCHHNEWYSGLWCEYVGSRGKQDDFNWGETLHVGADRELTGNNSSGNRAVYTGFSRQAAAKQFRGGCLRAVVIQSKSSNRQNLDSECWHLFQSWDNERLQISINNDSPLLGPRSSFLTGKFAKWETYTLLSNKPIVEAKRLVSDVEERGAALCTLLLLTGESPETSVLLRYLWDNGVRTVSTPHRFKFSSKIKYDPSSEVEFYSGIPRFPADSDWFEMHRRWTFWQNPTNRELLNLDSIIDPFLDRLNAQESNR